MKKNCKRCNGTQRIRLSVYDRIREYSKGIQELFKYDAETDTMVCPDCVCKLDRRVEYWLEKSARCRDDDRYLIAMIWHFEVCSVSELSAIEFIKSFGTYDIISHPDTITRIRRKLQEEHPSLRGRTFNERQKKSKKFISFNHSIK
jgi:hypothetical protein